MTHLYFFNSSIFSHKVTIQHYNDLKKYLKLMIITEKIYNNVKNAILDKKNLNIFNRGNK